MFVAKTLGLLPPEEAASCIADLVDAIAHINEKFLTRFPQTASLYSAGVVYDETDEWRDIPAILESGKADCKSLVAWRLAELRRRSEMALVHVVWFDNREPGKRLFHVQVRKGTKLEDPSRFLGMRS